MREIEYFFYRVPSLCNVVVHVFFVTGDGINFIKKHQLSFYMWAGIYSGCACIFIVVVIVTGQKEASIVRQFYRWERQSH